MGRGQAADSRLRSQVEVVHVSSMYSYIYEVSITNKCFQKFVLGTHKLKVFIPLVLLRTIHRITVDLELEGVHKNHQGHILALHQMPQ